MSPQVPDIVAPSSGAITEASDPLDVEFEIRSSEGCVCVYLQEREDGGLRVWSDDEPGLVLSGRDADAVSGDIWRGIKALRNFRQGGGRI